MDSNIQSCFEELENLINDEWVRDKVTALKQSTETAITAARSEALRDAAERAELEKVDAEETGTESDRAYNRGVEDAIRAILADKQEPL